MWPGIAARRRRAAACLCMHTAASALARTPDLPSATALPLRQWRAPSRAHCSTCWTARPRASAAACCGAGSRSLWPTAAASCSASTQWRCGAAGGRSTPCASPPCSAGAHAHLPLQCQASDPCGGPDQKLCVFLHLNAPGAGQRGVHRTCCAASGAAAPARPGARLNAHGARHRTPRGGGRGAGRTAAGGWALPGPGTAAPLALVPSLRCPFSCCSIGAPLAHPAAPTTPLRVARSSPNALASGSLTAQVARAGPTAAPRLHKPRGVATRQRGSKRRWLARRPAPCCGACLPKRCRPRRVVPPRLRCGCWTWRRRATMILGGYLPAGSVSPRCACALRQAKDRSVCVLRTVLAGTTAANACVERSGCWFKTLTPAPCPVPQHARPGRAGV